jgi:hypothetical protein
MITAAITPAPGAAAMAAERRTIPFDLGFRYTLTGERDRIQSGTVTVSIEASFTAVSIGYGVIPLVPVVFGPGLARDYPAPPSGPSVAAVASATPAAPRPLSDVSFGAVLNSLRRVLAEGKTPQRRDGARRPPRAVADLPEILATGMRVNPEVLSAVLLTGERTSLQASLLERLFQEVPPAPEQIQFLYALFDEGTGRAFQSDPILNTAGLGTADGDRPFRYFATPITFAPQTTIRMDVTEISPFPGELHVVLHGYKVLGEAGTPTGRARLQGRTGPRRR